MGMSVVSVALVIDTFLRLRRDQLLPPALVSHSVELAENGRVSELLAMTKGSNSLFGRIIGGALDRGRHGVDAIRQEMQQLGEAEILRLRTRVGYIGVIATVGPMLGLLGTVIGMISSFAVLGHAKGSARPDELAVGISTALVTTCEGLIIAVPMILFHAVLRDKVSQIAQESAALAEKVLNLLTISVVRQQQQRMQQPAPQPAQQPVQQQPAMQHGVAPMRNIIPPTMQSQG
jgi:biopolymer transport protein ExbB